MVDVLNERYELGEIVGSGGMGLVYRATDRRLGRTVAVKALRGGPLADDGARARMRSEANLAASISHPGVAQIFDVDDGSASDLARPFLVMQFVEGHTLAQLLRERGPMPPDQVMSVLLQVADGLQAAHDAGIVHRDLKPANIMLTPSGRTVLVDFGIARSATSEPLTGTGTLIGTADYMSPEQAAGRPATAQSDLYALGVVACHCLTGSSPFRRESDVTTALAHLNDDLPPLGADVPADVIDLVASLTAKNPSDRPASAAAVAHRAAEIGAAGSIDVPTTFDLPARAPSTPAHGLSVPDGSSEAAASTGRARRVRRKRSVMALAAVGALTVGLLLLGPRFRPGVEPVVPSVIGMTVDDASTLLRDAGLSVSRTTVDVVGRPAGQVLSQLPAPGEPEPDGSPVQISVASGRVMVVAGDVIGQTYAVASASLERLGFDVTRVDLARPGDAGMVVAIDRSGRLTDGSAITLSVAVAPPQASGTSPTTSTGSTAAVGTSSATSKGSSPGKGKDASPGQGQGARGQGDTPGRGRGRK